MPKNIRQHYVINSVNSVRPDPRKRAAHPILASLGPVVYAIRIDGMIKIGHTGNLSYRVKSFGLGFKAILGWQSGTMDDETRIHHSLRGLAIQGREFYPEIPPVIAVVNSMREGLGIPPLPEQR